MSLLLLLIAIAAPTLLAPLLFAPPPASSLARRVAPWAALPALVLAASSRAGAAADLPWLLLGSSFEIDSVGKVFLLITAVIWSAAGIFARTYIPEGEKNRFFFSFLLTMTGNLGLTIAADVVSFYLFFALMTFAGYGLIIHTGDREARWAGRVYIAMAVAAEGLLLAGLLLAVDAAGTVELYAIPAAVASSEVTAMITLLLLLGFAVKAGAVPLHVWLPLAHPVAPTPASAVLSGAMIKAGLLGWIRFLPLGHVEQSGWGSAMIALGLIAAFFGVFVGLTQVDPKTILAYSSISQMGLMNVAVGIGLTTPSAAAPVIAGVTVYAAHHGLAKGALFLGVGIVASTAAGGTTRRWAMVGLLFAAVALAGAPLTSGYLAKSELKALLPLGPEAWSSSLELFLLLSTAATVLLMLRFLVVVATSGRATAEPLTPDLWFPWAALLCLSAGAAWLLKPEAVPVPSLYSLAFDLLPLVAGSAVYWMIARIAPKWAAVHERPLIAPGDILHPIEKGLGTLLRPFQLIAGAADRGLVPGIARMWYALYSESGRGDRLIGAELALTRWAAGLSLMLLLCAIALALLAWGP